MKKRIIVVFLIIAAGFIMFNQLEKVSYKGIPSYQTIEVGQIADLFPQSTQQIDQLVQMTIDQARKAVSAIIAIPDEKRTFTNTVLAFDKAGADFSVASSLLSTLSYLSPDEAVRNQAKIGLLQLKDVAIDLFSQNIELYNAFNAYIKYGKPVEVLTAEQDYFIDETMKDFKRSGLHLPSDQQEKIKAVKKELGSLSIEFSKNINEDQSYVLVDRQELDGLSDDFIESLQIVDGKYKLGVDYPTYFEVMDHANIAQTRKKLYEKFINKAWPANEKVLENIIEKRKELAQLLGYPSYAHLNIDAQMAKTPERVKTFLDDLSIKTEKKEREEIQKLIKDLPPSVVLSNAGKLWPWDKAYLNKYHKKKYYNLDDREIAQYFPMEKTVERLMKVYEQFFNIKLSAAPIANVWHEDVQLMQVRRKSDNALLGNLLLDLYPRPNKYGHACEITILHAVTLPDGSLQPALAVVVANFPKSTSTKPSLLKLDDVRTFFHEFGHAIHTVLGATTLSSTSGTNVKTDFVELPSQMLEQWLWDPEILTMMSSHYQTGKPLSKEQIDTIIALKNFSIGGWINRQLFFAFLSLALFDEANRAKEIGKIQQELYKRLRKFDEFDENNHDFASFGHLTGYGASYYSYLWSQVFALDLFDFIKKQGLLNPTIGQEYAAKILGKGGSTDPDNLLKDFLGREPNSDAFFKDLGLQ